MAVPFALPDDDDNNVALEQIFNQIHDLLRLLQQQIESRRIREVGTSTRGKKEFVAIAVVAAAAAAGPVASGSGSAARRSNLTRLYANFQSTRHG